MGHDQKMMLVGAATWGKGRDLVELTFLLE